MSEFSSVGKLFIIIGIIMAIAGVIFIFGNKIPLLGKLPGDIILEKRILVSTSSLRHVL